MTEKLETPSPYLTELYYWREKKSWIAEERIRKLNKAERGQPQKCLIFMERAPSGASRCRRCGYAIEKEAFRIGFPRKDPRGDFGYLSHWLHVKCAFTVLHWAVQGTKCEEETVGSASASEGTKCEEETVGSASASEGTKCEEETVGSASTSEELANATLGKVCLGWSMDCLKEAEVTWEDVVKMVRENEKGESVNEGKQSNHRL